MEGEIKQGRPCEVCRSMKRREIEDAIYVNEKVSSISQRFTVSAASIYRHIKNHAAPEIQQAFGVTSEINVASITSRIKDIADAARDIRLKAETDEVALKAAAMELRTLESLAARMGIDHESSVRFLKEATELASAVGSLAQRTPGLTDQLVESLAKQGANELAEALALQA